MNVLVMMVDEMSWWALGHVDAGVHTPNIDRLAARAQRFTQAYTPSPICVPTRAAIATGRYVHETRNWSSAEPYDGAQRGWAHAVRDAGHDCVSIGKLHYRGQDADPFEGTDDMAREIGPGRTDYHDFDRRVTQVACDWLAEPARAERPWCAFVSWLAPHFPLIAPPEDYARYDPKAYESDAEPIPDHPILAALEVYFDHDRFFTPETRGIARAAYFGLCSFVDAQVGQVLDAVEQAGQAEDTLILFTSDHGEMLGEKGFWTKSTMYDSAARVPLLMAGPGIAAGDWDAPVSLIDLAPTICAAMEVTQIGSGTDLRAPDPARMVLSEYHDGGALVGMTMLRWGDWKLVYFAEGHPPQLFHMPSDPEEQTDLSQIEHQVLQDGLTHLHQIMDPEAINTQCFLDQASRIAALGGEAAVRAKPQFGYTPADSK